MSQEQNNQACGCGGCGESVTDAPAQDIPAGDTLAVSTPAPEAEAEKRKGFHPALVAATVIVVVFVLWFCPWALMRARTAVNESAAITVLESGKYLLMDMPPERLLEYLKTSRMSGDLNDLLVVRRNFHAARGVSDKSGAKLICFAPRYYGRTASRTFCLYKGRVFAKDLGGEVDPAKEPVRPDETWERIPAVAVTK